MADRPDGGVKFSGSSSYSAEGQASWRNGLDVLYGLWICRQDNHGWKDPGRSDEVYLGFPFAEL